MFTLEVKAAKALSSSKTQHFHLSLASSGQVTEDFKCLFFLTAAFPKHLSKSLCKQTCEVSHFETHLLHLPVA